MSLLFDEPMQPTSAMKLPTLTYFDEGCRSAPKTPKYKVLIVCDFHNGIKDYTTTKRSYMTVEGELAKKIPAVFRKKWYSELEDTAVPVYYLYDELRALAVQVEQVHCGSASRYGCLNYHFTHTKEQVLAYLLSNPVRAAKHDFAHGIVRDPKTLWPDSDWNGAEQQQEYQETLAQLKSPKPTLFQRLTAGMKIRFASPLTFDFQGQRLPVADFQVVKDGKKLRFVSIEIGFVAKISDADNMDFAVI